MSEKRRDNRNRVLRTGESQRPDGRYLYKYIDLNGKPQFAYSWRLEPGDRLPQGKREGPSLREKEKQIKRDLEDGIDPHGGDMTVLELVNKYLGLRPKVKENTIHVRDFVLQVLERTGFGAKRIRNVKQSDVKAWFILLQERGRPDGTGYGYSSIEAIRKVLRPAFKMAVNDDLLRKNPVEFCLSDAVADDSQDREALTPEQEAEYLAFVKNDPYYSRYYDAVYILFHTSLRISEFAGLTPADVDLAHRKITVDHQLLHGPAKGYYIGPPKTDSSVREIPMSDDVYACFQRLANRPAPKVTPMVDGKCGFYYLNEKGMPMTGLDWRGRFRSMWNKFSKTSTTQMQKVTPHICRHTFCSNMVRRGMNPKVLQYIMGHANVSTTLDTYTHLTFSDAEKELRRVVGGDL